MLKLPDFRKRIANLTLVTVNGAGHGLRGAEYLKRVREFFDRHLKKPATP